MSNDNFIMSPKIDFCFKELMTNEKVRKGFLSTILKIKIEDIKSTKIINPYLKKIHTNDKQGILDVRIELNNTHEIDIEMQMSKLRVWADRTLFYMSKMFVDQIEESDNYTVFRKCVNISVLDFTLFEDIKKFYSIFHIREDETNTLYSDKMEWHIIELPKLPKELKENSKDIELWAKFFNCEKREEFEMIAKKNPYIKEAYNYLEYISKDKQKRLEYEEREKAIRDYNAFISEAKEEGIEQGRKEGLEQGIAQGRKEGIKEATKQRNIEIAKNLLDILDVETIAIKTGLPVKTVLMLKDNK